MNEENLTDDEENSPRKEQNLTGDEENPTNDEEYSPADEQNSPADEDNSSVEAQSTGEWEAPLPPEETAVGEDDAPQMSEVSTLANIFIEPGKTFEDLRRKPRFLLGFLIIAVVSTIFAVSFQQKLGDERIGRAIADQTESRSPNITDQQKEQAVSFGLTIQKVVTYALPIFLIIAILIGSLIYWLGTKAMGGDMSFKGSISVWIYSMFPPTVISVFANFLILFLKSADDIDVASSQRGLVNANPSMFFGGKETPVLTTLISTIDFFAIWGLVLAAIGLQKIGKLSKGAAWGVVLILALIGITLRVISALVNGVPS